MKIELWNVTKRYGRIRALDNVTLELEPGSIIAVLGPNGAGKTTLLRCLAGIVVPDTGTVYYDGQRFSRDDLTLRKRIFFLPDFPFLFWGESVLRNIGIIMRIYGADGPGAEDRVFNLLRDFELLPLANTPVEYLSRGQLYKTALVALIATDPEVWILDEPMASGMDPLGQSQFKRLAREAANRGRTVIYSTQVLEVAERFSDRICVLHKGALRAYGTLQDLHRDATDKQNALEELFLKLHEDQQ